MLDPVNQHAYVYNMALGDRHRNKFNKVSGQILPCTHEALRHPGHIVEDLCLSPDFSPKEKQAQDRKVQLTAKQPRTD